MTLDTITKVGWLQRLTRRGVARIDSDRLEYFDLLPDEKPVETAFVYVWTEWPRAIGAIDDFYDDSVIGSDRYIIQPEELGRRGDLWGTATVPMGCVTAVTDQRICLHPVPLYAEGPGRYGRFETPYLGPRYIRLAEVSQVQAVQGVAVPVGAKALSTMDQGLVIGGESDPRSFVEGPGWPRFARVAPSGLTSLLMGFTGTPSAYLLVRALDAVDAPVPREMAALAAEATPDWRPLLAR